MVNKSKKKRVLKIKKHEKIKKQLSLNILIKV